MDAVERLEVWGRDPLKFVEEAFEWGKGELKDQTGPDLWQVGILGQIRDGLSVDNALLLATASGHGIGKSACVSWIILWAMGTMIDTKVVVTANTEAQLRTKTWPELAKWHRLCLLGGEFHFTATSLYSKNGVHEKTWRADAIPWSKTNPAAFAGLHNQGRRVLLVFDEASEIDNMIWEVAEGALTDLDTQILWAVFGNPTRNTGRFKECFTSLKHRWIGRQVDSRSSKLANKRQIDNWIEDYGEDSDFVRIRVKGEFPRVGSAQLISQEVVDRAWAGEANATMHDPIIMGVDVARYGEDQSSIIVRIGKDARFLLEKYRGINTMELADKVNYFIQEWQPDAVFIDESNMGGGVVDRLLQLGQNVIGVNFGSKAGGAVKGELVANKRAEMWVKMRNWLQDGGVIPKDRELAADLTAVQYGLNQNNAILLEKKDDMKKRGLPSPDAGDSLALTFAHPVIGKGRGLSKGKSERAHTFDYDPFDIKLISNGN